MSAWSNVIAKAFTGNQKIAKGHPDVQMSDGVPTAHAKVGTLCWDYTNEDAYISTDKAGTWVKINS